MTDPVLLQEMEIEEYWNRLKSTGFVSKKDRSILTIESDKEPCKVGFKVNEKARCPLFQMEKPHLNIDDFLKIVDRVVRYRKSKKEDV